MNRLERIKLEIAKEKACSEDLQIGYGIHIKQGDYKAASQCAWRIQQAAFKIKQLQAQLQDNENFYWLIENLRERGLGSIADKIVLAGGGQRANQN